MKICIKVRREESGWYTAVCPGLPGCSSRGQTCREAVVKIEDAIRGYVAAIGDFVPDKLDHDLVEVPPGSDSL
jgi:predicted RNase H-like HicB family nuclease